MSYIYLQEQGEESSAECFSDIPASVLSNLMSIQEKSCCNGNETESCHGSRFGTTSAPSTESRGEEESMSFAEDSPAKTLAQPEKAQELKESDPGFGPRWQESSVKYDLDTSSWKTHHCLWEEDLPWSSVTLPKWGMMRDGVLWERITPARLTSGTGSGLWPTPTANEDAAGTPDGKMQWMLTQAIKSGCKTRKQYLAKKGGNAQNVELGFLMDAGTISESGNALTAENGNILSTTTRAKDANIADQATSTGKNLESGGQPNPQWVEWLMGFPIGWTDCAASGMDKFQQWLRSHGKF